MNRNQCPLDSFFISAVKVKEHDKRRLYNASQK